MSNAKEESPDTAAPAATTDRDATDESSAPPATGGSSSSASGSVRTAKKVFVVKNGAMYTRPQRVVIPPRLNGKWDAILQLLDETCSVNGGVHRIVSTDDWKPAKSFDELEDAKLYCVLNNCESIQKLDYQGMANDSSRSSSPRRKPAEPKPLKRAGPKVPSRWAEKDNFCRFRIYVNKSNIVRPFVVNLNMSEIQKFSGALQNKICSPLEIVFKRIEQSCSLTLPENKPIRKMYTLEGVMLTDPSEITNEAAYVVAGNEAFVDLHYEARRLKNVIHHGPVAGKFEKTRYLGQLPSADPKRYAAQSRKAAAAQQRSRKPLSHRSEEPSENGDSTHRRDDRDFESNDATPRNGSYHNDQHNGYDAHHEDRYDDGEESIPRFGDDGAPKLIETPDSKSVDYENADVYSADYDLKSEQHQESSANGDLKDEHQDSDRRLDDRSATPRQRSPTAAADDDDGKENGALTARDPDVNDGNHDDDQRDATATNAATP